MPKYTNTNSIVDSHLGLEVQVPPDQLEIKAADRKAGGTFVPLVCCSCKQRRIKLKVSVVADSMNMLLGTEKTTPLICLPPVAVHVYQA